MQGECSRQWGSPEPGSQSEDSKWTVEDGDEETFLTPKKVDAKTLNVFKRRLDTAFRVNGIKGDREKAGLGS